MMKKILAVFMALAVFVGINNILPVQTSAAVARIDRTEGRDDGTWLFPLDKGYYNNFTDWAGCINGYCRLCKGNHVNDGWGDSWHDYDQFHGAGHNGFDVGADYGANVMAAAGGTVRFAAYFGDRGNTVIIEHPVSGTNKSYYSYYQHLSGFNVKVGATVRVGDVIGYVGNTGGNGYGVHLHFGMVLCDKNCDIASKLFTLECSEVLKKSDGFTKNGIILVNPSVRSVFPTGTSAVVPPLGYHSGSITYTFNKNEVSIGKGSQPTQTYDTIPDGTYLLYNRATNLALNLGWNNDANCENVHTYEFCTTNRGELMSITACSSDRKTYKIRPVDAKRLVQMYGESPYNGVNVCIYDDLANSTQWWKFKKVGNGYAIFIDCNTNYALSSVSENAVLNTYTGAGNQIWELIPYSPTYKVNYHANGGTGIMAVETFSVGISKNLAANQFYRNGYTFVGWSKSSTDTSHIYADKEAVTDLAEGASSVTLYAVWKANPVSTYTIQYNGNGQTSGTMQSTSAKYNSNVALRKNTFVKSGYTFKGWSTNKNATTAQYTDGQSVKNLAQSGTVTLYAVWEANSYTIQYNGNGQTSGTMQSTSAKYNSNVALRKNTFVKNGYTFKGWSTNKNATTAQYTDGQSVKNLAQSGTVTLYAVWEANSYTIQYNGNGQTSGTMQSTSAKYNSNVALRKNTFAKNGYTFKGWSTNKNATTAQYTDGQSVKNLAQSGTVTLYAVWEANSYTIQYNGNGQTGGTMQSTSAKYNSNVVLRKNTFVKNGYTFKGWSTNKNATTAQYTDGQSVKNLAQSGTVTLYAVWEANSYTIQYNGNGQTGGTMQSTSAKYNSNVALRKNTFVKSGYTFKGWSTNKNATTAQYTDGQSVKNLAQSGTVTLYAVWEEIKIPNITNLRTTNKTSNSITVSWDKLNVDGYMVYKDNTYLGTVNTNSYTFTGLKPNTTYKFMVYVCMNGQKVGSGISLSDVTLSVASSSSSTKPASSSSTKPALSSSTKPASSSSTKPASSSSTKPASSSSTKPASSSSTKPASSSTTNPSSSSSTNSSSSSTTQPASSSSTTPASSSTTNPSSSSSTNPSSSSTTQPPQSSDMQIPSSSSSSEAISDNSSSSAQSSSEYSSPAAASSSKPSVSPSSSTITSSSSNAEAENVNSDGPNVLLISLIAAGAGLLIFFIVLLFKKFSKK